jgi:hypothetical protein
VVKYDLIRYEDPREGPKTFFWINEEGIRISPYMSSTLEANSWMNLYQQRLQERIDGKW